MFKEIKKSTNYSLGFLWEGSNDGSVGSRNHRSTPVTVCICHLDEAPIDCSVQYEAGMADTKAKAESVARQYIRENGLRKELETKEIYHG